MDSSIIHHEGCGLASEMVADLAGTPREWARAVASALVVILFTWAVL